MTLFSLAGLAKPLGTPDCGEHPRWTAWECTVRARFVGPPFDGQTMVYRCAVMHTPTLHGPAVSSISCGPKTPPIRSGAVVPEPRNFENARDYAVAMTLYSLRSSKTVVVGAIDCGERATWRTWACSARARASAGPFAGRTLTYRCRPESASTARSVLCGPVTSP
jgi:hypothetical protein